MVRNELERDSATFITVHVFITRYLKIEFVWAWFSEVLHSAFLTNDFTILLAIFMHVHMNVCEHMDICIFI